MHRIRYFVGVITLGVVAASAWFLISLLSRDEQQGQMRVQVEFRDLRGLREGAAVKYRGVQIGTVGSVGLSKDGGKGVVRLNIEPGSERLLSYNTAFWIQSPRFEGLAEGLSGLDTLVRDAYLAVVTPEPAGPPLAPGSLVSGLEQPLSVGRTSGLDPLRPGDLEMTLLVPENHGLRIGSKVRYRGVVTGDVRDLELAADGSHVVVELRVHQPFRRTVTDSTQFWIARPRVSAELVGGVSVEDLQALFGAYVAYFPGESEGLPAPDGFRAIALPERPNIEVEELPESLLDASEIVGDGLRDGNGELQLVEVVYEATEEDWLSANDIVQRSSTGLLLTDSEGQMIVVTPRSACDASWFLSDTFGADVEIGGESIRVSLPGGNVLRAGRNWVEPNGADLAVLGLDDPPPGLLVSRLSSLDFSEDASGVHSVQGVDDDAATPVEGIPDPANARGSVLLRDGRVRAMVGQAAGRDETPAAVGLHLLPPALRPAR